MKKLLSFLALIAFAVMIYMNYLSGTGQINQISISEVSANYPTLFTPAGFTFTIWSLIYLAGFIFVINLIIRSYKVKQDDSIRDFSILYTITCIINILWIFSWHHQILWLSEILMLGLLSGLIWLYLKVLQVERTSMAQYFISVIPISLYLGWIMIATVANTSVLLVSLGWDGSPLTEAFWASLVILVAALINVGILVTKRDIFIGLVYLWAAYGIISARAAEQTMAATWVARFAVAGMVLVFLGILYARFVKARKIKADV